MPDRKIKILVFGKVQGVYFRYHTKLAADRLGLSGWVRNRADGSVEAHISGNTDCVEEMIDWLQHGPDGSSVHNVQINELEDKEMLDNEFLIRY